MQAERKFLLLFAVQLLVAKGNCCPAMQIVGCQRQLLSCYADCWLPEACVVLLCRLLVARGK